jgi:hypothetical protein
MTSGPPRPKSPEIAFAGERDGCILTLVFRGDTMTSGDQGLWRSGAVATASFLFALCLLWAVPATVGAAWSPGVNVSGPSGFVSRPHVGLDASGDAVLMWERSDAIETRVRRANGTLTPIQSVAPAGATEARRSELDVNAAGEAVFGWIGNQGYVKGRIRHADGTLGPTLKVGRALYSRRVQVGIDAAGRAVVAWSTGDQPTFIRARSVSPSGALAPVRSVAQGVATWRMGVASTGPAVFGWVRDDTDAVYTRTRSPAGDLGPPRRVSRAGRRADLNDLAVNPEGDAAFIWREEAPTAYVLLARVVSADGAFSPRYVLRGGHHPQLGQVALNSSGEVTACYYVGGESVEARSIAANGTVGPTLRFPGARLHPCSTAIDEQGNAVFGWTLQSPARVNVRRLDAGGALGPTQVLAETLDVPVLAANPAGRFVAVWVQGASSQVRLSVGP